MKFTLTFSILLIISCHGLFSQTENYLAYNIGYYRIAFWNVENFYDYKTDSSSSYTEFNRDGNHYWTAKKYKQKQNAIYKSIIALGGWRPVALMGFAELENEFVLNDLLKNTPLRNQNYGVVYFESNDSRGIDVGMIYQKEQFSVLFAKKLLVKDASDLNFTTRDILYVKGLLGSDTIHVFVNHWPSRYRGYLSSEPLRIIASKVLRHSADSISRTNPDANILIMGDFNDNASDPSVSLLSDTYFQFQYFPLPLLCENKDVMGTIKYQGKWDYFDHLIVSEALIGKNGKLAMLNQTGYIFAPSFLLEEDEKFLGVKPKRTFVGMKYNGGISDHLPVFVDIIKSDKK